MAGFDKSEHRTLNVQRRIMYSINLIKTLVKTNLLLKICPPLEDSVVCLYKIDQAQRYHYWMFDVGSAGGGFDVQSVNCTDRAESHTRE